MKYVLKMIYTLLSVAWLLLVTAASCVNTVEGNHSEPVHWFVWVLLGFGPILVVGMIGAALGSALGWLFQGRPRSSDHMTGLRARRNA
jgi:hypothetical protein